MGNLIYLRCFGGGGIIVSLNINTLNFEKKSFEFYKKGGFVISGMCNFLNTAEKEKLFVALYIYEEKMFLCIDKKVLDLFDESINIKRKAGLVNNKIMIFLGDDLIREIKYRTIDEVDDIFSYVNDVLSNFPRQITMKKYILEEQEN